MGLAGAVMSARAAPAPIGPVVDELEQLYGQELAFRADGVPIISVRLTWGQRRIRFAGDGPLVIRLGRHGAREVTVQGSDEWMLRLKNPHRGKTKTWVVAERFVGSDPDRVASSTARWIRRGYRVKVFMSGTRVDIEGQRLDTRIATVAISPERNRRQARRRAQEIKQEDPILGRIIDDFEVRPGGVFQLTNQRTGEQLVTKDLVAIRALQPDGVVELRGVKWPRTGRGTRRFPGEVSMLVSKKGKLVVVNQVDAETVVDGVVPTELFPEAPIEALKAQAVVARGQLLAKLGHRHPGEPYHLCALAHCQAYAGVERRSPRSRRSVASTQGQILFDRFGLTDTVYHSSCGGHTEAYHRVWGGPPNRALSGVADGPAIGALESEASVSEFLSDPPRAWCSKAGKTSGSFRWTANRKGADITRRVNAYESIGAVHGIRVVRRGRSGRSIDVEYQGLYGRYVAKGWARNRRILGALKSGLWVVTRSGGKPRGQPAQWSFRGGGYGHGVGMCQYGALGMAGDQRSYVSILAHYFPHTRLETLW